jgi:hypothetical protein
MRDGAHARAQMLADMDAARHEINVLYYIWLDDSTGTDVAHALMRAAQRGVTCRAMVDGLGSRALTRSPLWQQMRQAGVHLAIALPISNLLKVMLTSRIDLRNHRKITLMTAGSTIAAARTAPTKAFASRLAMPLGGHHAAPAGPWSRRCSRPLPATGRSPMRALHHRQSRPRPALPLTASMPLRLPKGRRKEHALHPSWLPACWPVRSARS